MSTLHPTLQQTESLLRDLHTNLKKAYPATKHELDLEFAGCTQAARTATGKFASLKADINSAMDSLLAAAATDDSVGTGTGRGRSRSVAQDARLSTQLARREAYLDQLTARMQSKAEALCGDIATLDDHLESIQEIVQREMRARSSFGDFETTDGDGPSNGNGNAKGIWAFIDAIVPFTSRKSSVRTGEDEASTSEMRADTNLSDSLRQATNHHRPVADLIRRLYIDLQNLQRKKGNLV
jgi:hypothetical protein